MGDNCNISACSNLSDHSENSSDGLPSHSHGLFSIDNVCRDFMRNACNRGSHCRFRHPAEEEAKRFSEDFSPREMTFCHDFQNKGCNRHDCRFIHCTRDEEEAYRRTGVLPKFVQSSTSSRKLPPICIDFNKGVCQRGPRCKYRHILSEEVYQSKEDTDLRKKRKYDTLVSDEVNQFKNSSSIDYQLLEEENNLLRRRIEDLERQLSVLVASNELLLEQNARYRSCKLITVPPIVAVSQMLTPTITPAPISVGSRPITALHHQTPHGITTMATLSIGASQREFVIPSAQPPQQQQQSLSSQAAAVDQSISMAMAPVAIETVPMTPCSNLSNGALSQQQTMAAALSLSMPHPSPASLCSLMGNSNLVSYPLISHARLPTSSLG